MNLLRKAGAGLLISLFTASTFAQSGFDTTRMDTSINACNNFYQFANGTWLKKTAIPAAFPSWGTWDILITRNREISRGILEAAMKNTAAKKGSSTQLVGDYYASCMDEAGIEAAGTKPLDPYFKEIDAIKDVAGLRTVIAHHIVAGMNPVIQFYAYPDAKNSKMNIANLYQGGLSLPTSEYYTNTDAKSVEIRNKFAAHLERMFGLLGDDAATAKAHASTVLAIENRLAKASKTPVELRDPANYYNPMTVADVNKLTPGFDWASFAKEIKSPSFSTINTGQPDFLKEVAKMITDVPLDQWKTYLKWNVLNASASRLAKRFEDADFDFYSRTLNGTEEQLPRWRRCTRQTDNMLGEALGEEFIKTQYTPTAKKRMDELIDNLFAVYKDHINKLDWMSDTTRAQALAKLSMIRRKVGYPEKPRGYAGLSIDRKSYFDNTIAGTEFLNIRANKDIGTPPDPDRWGTAATVVNAYYNSTFNDITFPAGILQPPFFDPKLDDAMNYGAIGVVIGHELTHGFDDSGSRYDGQGNLRMWWTDEDRKKFEEKVDCVATQFSGYEVEPGLNINGKLTLGENTADLGGMAIAFDAFKKSMEGKPRPANIDGMTPEQRFFLGWAQVWAENDRPEYARLIVQSDPHSLAQFRVNGPLSNFPEFAKAYSCKIGDKMVREKQCRVW
jgi:putative endopeptidase